MVFKSDIEEIEIDADPSQFYAEDDDDSNSNSNFSDASSRQDRRSLRARSTKGTFLKGTANETNIDETSQSSAGSSTRRATKNSKKYTSQLSNQSLKERELTDFLGDFDLSTSKRERKKQVDYTDNRRYSKGGMMHVVNIYNTHRVSDMDGTTFKELLHCGFFWCRVFFLIIFMVEKRVHLE